MLDQSSPLTIIQIDFIQMNDYPAGSCAIIPTAFLLITVTNNSNFLTVDVMNDTTIKERVTVLEFQVAGLTDDVTTITDDIADLEEGLTLVETEQIIQDERILELESDTTSKHLARFKKFLFLGQM